MPFRGCGRYLGDYRLNDIWALEQLNGTPPDQANMPKGVPTLELQLSAQKVLGYGGCNRFQGKMEVTDNQIKFSQLAATRMACPNLQTETSLLKALSGNPLTFSLSEGKLTLTNETTALTFKKLD